MTYDTCVEATGAEESILSTLPKSLHNALPTLYCGRGTAQ